MKTIKEKAFDYIQRVNDSNIEQAYLYGAYETLQTILDRLRDRYQFYSKFNLDDVSRIITEMRNGNTQ